MKTSSDIAKDSAEAGIVEELIANPKFLSELVKDLSTFRNVSAIRSHLKESVRKHREINEVEEKVTWSSTGISPNSLSVLLKLWERLQYPKDWDYLKMPGFLPPDEAFFRPATTQEAINSITIRKTEKETNIMAGKFFEQKAFLNDVDISQMSKDRIFSAISAQEAHISSLKSITTQPKVLKDEIVNAEAQLKALVEYLDSKETPAV